MLTTRSTDRSRRGKKSRSMLALGAMRNRERRSDAARHLEEMATNVTACRSIPAFSTEENPEVTRNAAEFCAVDSSYARMRVSSTPRFSINRRRSGIRITAFADNDSGRSASCRHAAPENPQQALPRFADRGIDLRVWCSWRRKEPHAGIDRAALGSRAPYRAADPGDEIAPAHTARLQRDIEMQSTAARSRCLGGLPQRQDSACAVGSRRSGAVACGAMTVIAHNHAPIELAGFRRFGGFSANP